MTQLVPLQIDEHTLIYIEPSDAVQPPSSAPPSAPGEVTRGDLGLDPKGVAEAVTQQATQVFQNLETTLKAYTRGTINAFKELGDANVDKVKLEFGVNVGGEAGVPYVTKGTADCSLKITVECSFPKETKDEEAQE
ncbi:MAG: CU044_2847 family protein [Elainellaceae cyanobacterium]